MSLQVVPVTIAEANAYVVALHRHNGALPTAKLASAVVDDGGLVRGVAIAGLPKARLLLDRRTLEVSRVCSDGTRNACSMLYGSMVRAAKALGYRRLVTYTLEAEHGASLRASGWTYIGPAGGGSWADQRGTGTVPDLGAKVRWEIHVPGPVPELRWPDGVLPPEPASLFDTA